MKIPLGAAAALLVVPLVLAAQTPTPTMSPGVSGGTFDARKNYAGVLMQQGRVQTDADWNEQVQACKRENEALKMRLRARANELETQLRQLQAAADQADTNRKSAQDHNKTIKDSIRKMLDQVAEINRATSLK